MVAIQVMASPACAKNYVLDYRIETPMNDDVGSTSCAYGVCRVEIKKLNVTLIISLSRDDPRHARIEIEGRPGCCFFELGAQSQRIVLDDDPPQSLRFFAGVAARGLLLVQNEPAGILSLRFRLD
ncbi:hypothetical protein ACU4GH_25335 [Bradyrhizobium betae]|uniref:hypothetical protein n=1 Tax=Bradyrhizobium betae TaxID=244734 RepID=UPI003D67F0E6